MKVSDIMVSPVTVTQGNKSLGHVAGLMEKKGVSAIPVLAMDGTIEGIITASDLLHYPDSDRLVSEVMTTKTHVVSPESGATDAAKMMERHHVHHLIAMADGQVVGILSSMDFVKIVAKGS